MTIKAASLRTGTPAPEQVNLQSIIRSFVLSEQFHPPSESECAKPLMVEQLTDSVRALRSSRLWDGPTAEGDSLPGPLWVDGQRKCHLDRASRSEGRVGREAERRGNLEDGEV